MTDRLPLHQVEGYLGRDVFARGRAYADEGQVLRVLRSTHDRVETVRGSVVGKSGLYETKAYFLTGRGGEVRFGGGECTCPMVEDCKHVAALVIAAERGGTAVTMHGSKPERRGTWDEPLVALVGGLQEARTATAPLAIELVLEPSGTATSRWRLMGRLMRPAARGVGWANGNLAWNALDEWSVQRERIRADHAALAYELYTLHSARARSASGYAYSRYSSYGAEKSIDLTHCGPELWGVLDEAADLGLVLIHGKGRHGELPRPVDGRVVLDVTAASQGLRVTPKLDLGADHALSPAAFIGRTGHGLVCTEQVDDNAHPRLHLVRLIPPAGPELQRMLMTGQIVDVPAAEVGRFADELCPGLQRVATVVSSDGSFTPPEVSAPALVLHVGFGDAHDVQVGWQFTYEIGGSTREVWLGGEYGGEYRNPAAERALLDTVDARGRGLESLGLVDNGGRPRETGALLSGLNSMRFVTNVLPRLNDIDGASLVVEGEPADYRDVGDAIEIGVSTAESTERDWFNLGVQITVAGRQLPLADVFRALAAGHTTMLLDDGAHFSLLEPRLQALRELIEEARLLDDVAASGLRISRYQIGLWDELAALGVVTEQATAWREQVERLRALESLPAHEPPASLEAELRPYQREGFAWLALMWELGLGGVLADDMGLGKTLQTLALLLHARDADPNVGPFLVVAPTSVVPGWVSEAAHFAPGLRVEAVTDTLKKSGRIIDEIAKADVVVTTYTLLRLDAAAYASVRWAGVVLDEAQYVKNHNAKTYRSVRELGSPFTLALTGTPMENNLLELWSLLSITAPGLFADPKGFAEHFAKPIERTGDAERLAQLRRRIKPLMKRRTKELVARDLPPKQEQTLEVELHARHRKIYDTQLQRERQRVLGLLGDFDRNRFTILRSITVLRQLSLHPGLVDPANAAIPCAKLDALSEQLVDVVGGGHRALVFSQFTSFLSLVRARLDRDGVGYAYLDGRTRNRGAVVDGFRSGDAPVFLISLKAGGFGLNLTEADYCFLLDPWWNPATENQAIDRTHRIGQLRPVNVYRLIAANTIEEKVVALAQRKAKLFSGVMDDGDLFASALSADDIRGLFD
jgi:superfamily II DNA or RNA helicase